MNIRNYFMERMNGKEFTEEEYTEDNRAFFEANRELPNELARKIIFEEFFTICAIGGGDLWYEKDFAAEFIEKPEILNVDKRWEGPITADYVRRLTKNWDYMLYFFTNVLHCLKNPVDYLEALPEGAVVVIIDTFMAKPNSDWQLFFDNYMYQINGTRLPKMAEFEFLPGWKTLARKQNHGELDLGYLILERIV